MGRQGQCSRLGSASGREQSLGLDCGQVLLVLVRRVLRCSVHVACHWPMADKTAELAKHRCIRATALDQSGRGISWQDFLSLSVSQSFQRINCFGSEPSGAKCWLVRRSIDSGTVRDRLYACICGMPSRARRFILGRTTGAGGRGRDGRLSVPRKGLVFCC